MPGKDAQSRGGKHMDMIIYSHRCDIVLLKEEERGFSMERERECVCVCVEQWKKKIEISSA